MSGSHLAGLAAGLRLGHRLLPSVGEVGLPLPRDQRSCAGQSARDRGLESGFRLRDGHGGVPARRLPEAVCDRRSAGEGSAPLPIQAVPAPPVRRDRTYTSAVALAKRFQIESVPPTEINLVSVGPHCRRSRMLFAKALGDGIRVGILPVAPDDYDPAHWWRSSQGFRTVSGEVIAYVYARLFFNPAEEL
jgi:hypothetical protein